MPTTRYRIPESQERGGYGRLGRHINHDSRSLAFRVASIGKPTTARWTRKIPVLDQGSLSSCTGNAGVGVLGTEPFFSTIPGGVTLDEGSAIVIYSEATKIDPFPGQMPADDTGSDGLSVAKVLRARELIAGYLHITSVEAAWAAIKQGPFMVGTNWYQGMDGPDGDGRVRIAGAVRGGHEYECAGYDTNTGLWEFWQSWGQRWGMDGRFFYTDDDLGRLLSEGGDATLFVPRDQVPPAPAADPAQTVQDFYMAAGGWARARHTGANHKAALAAQQLFAANGIG